MGGPGLSVPGLDVVLPGRGGPPASVVRSGGNQWLLGLGGPAGAVAAVAPGSGPAGTDPGEVAGRVAGQGGGFVARVELDACGAWVTVACTADLRPLVVRRAGWVDERGDAVVGREQPWPEDRVGLGPGDAVAVVHHTSMSHDAGRPIDPVAECLLDHLGSGAQGLVDAECGTASCVVAALAVPAWVADAGPGWVAEATGMAEADLVLPGYPLGDREPERWRLPPSAPRRAAFRLHRDTARLRELRSVLGRLVRSWRLHDRLDDDVLTLLTTELATNALVHTSTAATATISYLGDLVRVEVVDGSSCLPKRRDPEESDVGGRGIALIEELATGWGTSPTPTGKRTWFELPVAAQAV